MKHITIHDQAYEVYSWAKFGEAVFELSKQIIETGEHFDRIIALAKGGIEICRPISDFLAIKELSSIHIEFYTGIGTTARTPVITQSLPVRIKDERILVIDDIADSGETLILATKYLLQHGAKDIQTATLVSKPWTKHKPTFSQYESKAWVVFPWETRETIQLLAQIWGRKGDSSEVITKQLETLGFTSAEIELFTTIV
jgi:uncharacterized protein